MNLEEFKQRVQLAGELDFGELFNESVELFKKVWLQGFITLLLSGLIVVPFIFLLSLPLTAAEIIDPEAFQDFANGSQQQLDPWVLVPFYAMFALVMIAVMFVSMSLKAAFFRICRNKSLGIEGGDHYFHFFKGKYIGKIIVLALATTLISFIATLLCFFPIFYVMVPVSFFTVIFAFNPEMSAGDIIKAGFELGNKKWLLTFGLMLVCGFIAEMVGILLCGIGLFFTASFSYIPLYLIYSKTIGFEEHETTKKNDLLM